MTPDDLEKFKTYARLQGKYLEQCIIVTALYEDRNSEPRDDGFDGVREALREHVLPRHVWPLPASMSIDDAIGELQWLTGTFDHIISQMEEGV